MLKDEDINYDEYSDRCVFLNKFENLLEIKKYRHIYCRHMSLAV